MQWHGASWLGVETTLNTAGRQASVAATQSRQSTSTAEKDQLRALPEH